MNTQYTRLSMTPSGVLPVIYMSQYDVGRPIGFICDEDLDSYTVTLEATRTDGTAITAAITTDGEIGAFATTATMTNVADEYVAQVVITDSDSNRIASIPVRCIVVEAAMDENAEAIEEDASLFQQYTETINSAVAEISASVADAVEDIAKIRHDTVAAMVADSTLAAGDYVRTGGYYAISDGGGAYYYIRAVTDSDTVSDSADGTTSEDGLVLLSNGLVAELVCGKAPANVRQFGAYGDNTHTDTTAFSNAIAYAKGTSKQLYIPAGRYRIDDALLIDADNFSIFGDGDSSYISNIKESDSTTFRIFAYWVRISNLMLGGMSIGNTILVARNYCTITKVHFAYGGTAIAFSGGNGSFVDNCYIHDVSANGIYVTGTNDVYISNTVITHCPTGLGLNNSHVEAVQMVNSTILSCANGISAEATYSATHPRYCKFTNCYFDSATNYQINLVGVDSFKFANCWFSARSTSNYATVRLVDTIECSFIGCEFYNNYAGNTSSSRESKSITVDANASSRYNALLTVSNCTFRRFGKFGIYLGTNATGVIITGNTFIKDDSSVDSASQSVRAVFFNGSGDAGPVIATGNIYDSGLAGFTAGTRPGIVENNFAI